MSLLFPTKHLLHNYLLQERRAKIEKVEAVNQGHMESQLMSSACNISMKQGLFGMTGNFVNLQPRERITVNQTFLSISGMSTEWFLPIITPLLASQPANQESFVWCLQFGAKHKSFLLLKKGKQQAISKELHPLSLIDNKKLAPLIAGTVTIASAACVS